MPPEKQLTVEKNENVICKLQEKTEIKQLNITTKGDMTVQYK